MMAWRYVSITGRRGARWAATLLAGCLALGWIGCGPPTENVLIGADGTSIRLTQIIAIRDNTEMSDSEKRQALLDLGITDEALIDIFLQ
jgi:hypothetical protein